MARQDYVTIDMPLGLLMERWPCTISVFLRHGMLCVGCQVTEFHTVADACREHCVDKDDFLQELTDAVRKAERR